MTQSFFAKMKFPKLNQKLAAERTKESVCQIAEETPEKLLNSVDARAKRRYLADFTLSSLPLIEIRKGFLPPP